MRKIIKSILIVLLLLLGLGATSLLATEITPAAKDTLIVKQFSIDFPDSGNESWIGSSEGVLTFRVLAGKSTGLDAGQIMRWIEDGSVKLRGIRFDTDRAIMLHQNKLSIPFEFERPLQGEYLETELRIAGSDWVADAGTPVSLYGGSHGVVDISLSGEGKQLAGQQVNMSAANFLFDPVDLSSRHQPVSILAHKSEDENSRRSGFLSRNRYWVMGAATIVASSTTALIMTGGDSVTYLPEPPGRP